MIAMKTRTHEVLAVGDEALQLIGRRPGTSSPCARCREGAITDFDITERTIRLLLRRAGVTKLNRPRVLPVRPGRRDLRGAPGRQGGGPACRRLGRPSHRTAHGRAIGAGLDVHEPVGSMVVDVGGGTTETAVISLGGIVAYRAVRCGGYDMDAAVQEYVRQTHGVAISERTGEELKIAIGSARATGELRAEVRVVRSAPAAPDAVVLRPRRSASRLRSR